MFFQPYYLACLAHASYMIGDGGEAVVVDPQRDVDDYISDAAAAGLRIAHIIETHLHADFVSGHVELAERTGATIHVCHLANAEYRHNPVRDGDEIHVGGLTLQILETPGHTPESISIVAYDEGAPAKLFSGDTLFIGEVGRPDLAGWRGHSRDEMALDMFRSLRDKILTLPDSVEVWPAHGAGSACGKSISDERTSTLGRQKRENWGLRMVAEGDQAGFLRELTSGLPSIPAYFPHDVVTNRRGAASIDQVTNVARALSADEVEAEVTAGAVLLDTRSSDNFARGHIAGSINVPIEGKFAPWVGVAVASDARLVLATDEGKQDEAVMRLTRIGYDKIAGWLNGSIRLWRASGRPLFSFAQVSGARLADRYQAGVSRPILDVRTSGEWLEGHIEGSIHIPLLELSARIEEVPFGPLTVVCGSGYRSSIACSLLARNGWTDLENVDGGWTELGPALARL
ncbi:MBL fold metallo-hydrolase [Fimbriimonas ginsengisoli]|uniref:Rhodanese-like protein n=1 Tax=Fimbriimonas ginsengisoli Gsoil 348 TaxID=661478 RepID=A0A068NNC6_FIMGI|nr:MBL fold metallo-hydrolase [Fimbriimonas ginsengisoli]AIE84260.1 rhodanese-like protein [Fimbriimonas ginsengisoli Gsoil 348]